ncbi:cyclin protein [Rutstroemia sp. NJR-2017a WRK4]|nr:cyclin protein [Rutstroemia sp. NJR-2017a WRK4]
MPSPMSMASRKRSSSISSVESFDSDFFEQTYVPLSNLPTPPLSSHSHDITAEQSPVSLFSSDEILDPELLGPAIHLTNLIPSSTSLTEPSLQLVHSILSRADLPIEILALAVCILDSLNSRFARHWRHSFPLESPIPFYQAPHIDSTHPEIIVLAALILAKKFLDDDSASTRYYAAKWGQAAWSCDQINYTQRCVMENLGYRLLPLWEDKIIQEAKMDMERARKQYVASSSAASSMCMGMGMDYEWEMKERRLGFGQACMGLQQPTPVETPMIENLGTSEMMVGTATLSRKTKMAFRGEGAYHDDVDGEGEKEQFPLYVDPLVGSMAFGYGY